MNRIMILVIAGLLLLAPISVLSQYDRYDENEENDDVYDSASDRDQDEVYESSFGNRYEYDLNDPGDRVMYEADSHAQLRDSIDVNPVREVERDIGENGGGVLDDE